MKGVHAALVTNDHIKRELYTPARKEFHVMDKSEGGKSRPVVKTSNHTNRKMDSGHFIRSNRARPLWNPVQYTVRWNRGQRQDRLGASRANTG